MLNQCNFIGRLTHDPKLSNVGDNDVALVKFTLAVTRDKSSKEDEPLTDFFNCIAWKQQAEFIGNYVRKGHLVFVTGRMQIRKYEDNEGNEKKSIELMIPPNGLKLLTSKAEAERMAEGRESTQPTLDNPFANE